MKKFSLFGLVACFLVSFSSRAFAYWIGPPAPLAKWNQRAQLIFKAQVLEEHVTRSQYFPSMVPVQVRVISVLKGELRDSRTQIRVPAVGATWKEVSKDLIYSSLPAPLEQGRCYIFWAIRDAEGLRAVPSLSLIPDGADDASRELRLYGDATFRCASNDKTFGTAEETVWRELQGLMNSDADTDYALQSLARYYQKGEPHSEQLLRLSMTKWSSNDERQASRSLFITGAIAARNDFEQAFPLLRRLVINSPFASVRLRALQSLVASNDRRVGDALVEIIHKNENNQEEALIWLANYPSSENLAIWQQCAKSTKVETRLAVVSALAYVITKDSAVLPVVDILANDSEPHVRSKAIEILEQQSSTSPIAKGLLEKRKLQNNN